MPRKGNAVHNYIRHAVKTQKTYNEKCIDY